MLQYCMWLQYSFIKMMELWLVFWLNPLFAYALKSLISIKGQIHGIFFSRFLIEGKWKALFLRIQLNYCSIVKSAYFNKSFRFYVMSYFNLSRSGTAFNFSISKFCFINYKDHHQRWSINSPTLKTNHPSTYIIMFLSHGASILGGGRRWTSK